MFLGVTSAGTIHRSELRFYRPTWRNRLYYRFTDNLIAVSDERKHRLIHDLQLPEDRVETIHWGIDISPESMALGKHEARKKLGLGKGRIIFSLGHLGPIKGHEDSIKAMAIVKSVYTDCRLYIGGDGTIADHERLHELIEKMHLQGDVIMLGQITNSLEWMMACDIFLQPSREEAFGLVFLEAGLCEKPSVSTRVGGIPEILTDGQNGYTVKTHSPEELAARILELYSEPGKIEEMGASAKKIVTERFDLCNQLDQLEKHFKTIVGKT